MDKFLSGAAHGVRVESVLSHEQRHFDLTEVHARRLGRHVLTLQAEGTSAGEASADLDRQVREAYRRAAADLEEQQRRYDGETAHGTMRKAQKRWARDIDRWLQETSG